MRESRREEARRVVEEADAKIAEILAVPERERRKRRIISSVSRWVIVVCFLLTALFCFEGRELMIAFLGVTILAAVALLE